MWSAHPDFYLPSFDRYIEIKGHWFKSNDGRIDDRRKMDLVKFANPEIDLVILNSLDSIKTFTIPETGDIV